MKYTHLNSYNSPNTLLVITSIPAVKKNNEMRKGFNAIGWHSEKTLKSIAQNRKIVVCAEKNDEASHTEGEIRIERIWTKSNPFSLFSVLSLIQELPQIQSVFVPFEFNVFGGILPNLVLLAVLFILRLMKKQVTVEVHQVILDIAKLVKHVSITNPSLQLFFNLSLRIFYCSLGLVANSIIVFEEELKNRLLPFVKADKIQVLSLAIEQKKIVSQKQAQKKLGIPQNKFVIMVFGFINGYKGIDWLIDTFKQYKQKDIVLLIAGGKNPYLAQDKHYQRFYNSIIKSIGKDNRIVHTGFVPDKDVATCFSACDLAVLPYEVFMSASGPFSLALSYKKPIILSQALSLYANSLDVQKCLEMAKITSQELFFPLEKEGFFQLVNKYKTSSSFLAKLTQFSSLLGTARSMKSVIKKYEYILFPNTSTVLFPEIKSAPCSLVLS